MTPPCSLKLSNVNKFNSIFENNIIDFVFFRRKRIHGISPTDILNLADVQDQTDVKQDYMNKNSGNEIIDCKVTRGLTDLRLKYDYQSLTDIVAHKVLKQVFNVKEVNKDGTKTNKKNLKVNKLGLVSRERKDENGNEFYSKTNNILFKPQKNIRRSNSISDKYYRKEIPLQKNTFVSVILREKGSPPRKFKFNQSESMDFAVRQTNCPVVMALRKKLKVSVNEKGHKSKKYSDTKLNKTKKGSGKNIKKHKVIATKYRKRHKSVEEFNGIRILIEMSERIGILENLVKEYMDEMKKPHSVKYKKRRKRKVASRNKDVYPFKLTLTDLYLMYKLKSKIYLLHPLIIPLKETLSTETIKTGKINTNDFVELSARLKDAYTDFQNSNRPTVGTASPFLNLKELYKTIQFSSATPIIGECDHLSSKIQENINNHDQNEKSFNNKDTSLETTIAYPSSDLIYLNELQKKNFKKKRRSRKLRPLRDSNNVPKV